MQIFGHVSLSVLALMVAAAPAGAAQTFFANLTLDQEFSPIVPTTSTGGPRPISFGTATFVLNDAQTELSMFAEIFNIDVTGTQTLDTNDNLVAAHIHAGPNPPPLNNSVVWGFFGAPDNDVAPDNLVVTPFASGVGGTFSSVWNASEGNNTTLGAQLPNIFAGNAYLNFHTVQAGGGEIRGQLLIPEPATWLMLIAGFGLVGVQMRRKAMRTRSA